MRPVEIILSAFLLLSTGLNCFLLRQPLAMFFRESLAIVQPETIPLSFTAKSISGKDVEVNFGASDSTLIYYVDPHCSWCRKNLSAFQSLQSSLASSGVKLFVFTHESGDLRDVVPSDIPPDRILVVSDAQASNFPHFSEGTPQTFWVNRKGELRKRWVGAYSPATLSEVKSYAVRSKHNSWF